MTNRYTRRIGYWLSLLGIVLGLAYLVLIIAALASGTFPPSGLLQILLHIGILLTVPCMVILWVAVHLVTPAERQVFSLGSLVLMAVFAVPTSINRYNALMVIPKAVASGNTDGLEWFLPYGGPTVMAAMEVLSFGYLYGLACLCLAPAFGADRLEKAIFWTLIASGGMSLSAILAQALDSIPLTIPGILAWGPGFVLLAALWALWFKRQAA